MTTPESPFHKLNHVFSTRGNSILEIEIISPTLGAPFLQDGSSIGLTKKALVQAYTVARQIFFQRLMFMSEEDFQTKRLEDGPSDEEGVTEIMLLFDCEHLTACNWRKRRLLAAQTYCLKEPARIDLFKKMLETELTLLTSYQTSPLHRHTKSPTLWSHRVWVWKQLLMLEHRSVDVILKLQYKELVHALRAAELHPRNYYAFTYMRQLHSLLTRAVRKDELGRSKDLATELLDPVLDWCFAHPRDISGWAFSKNLLDQIPDHETRSQTTARVLVFARDIGWEGESLWTFVDQTVREFALENAIHKILPLQAELPVSTENQPGWTTRLARAKAYWAASKPAA